MKSLVLYTAALFCGVFIFPVCLKGSPSFARPIIEDDHPSLGGVQLKLIKEFGVPRVRGFVRVIHEEMKGAVTLSLYDDEKFLYRHDLLPVRGIKPYHISSTTYYFTVNPEKVSNPQISTGGQRIFIREQTVEETDSLSRAMSREKNNAFSKFRNSEFTFLKDIEKSNGKTKLVDANVVDAFQSLFPSSTIESVDESIDLKNKQTITILHDDELAYFHVFNLFETGYKVRFEELGGKVYIRSIPEPTVHPTRSIKYSELSKSNNPNPASEATP